MQLQAFLNHVFNLENFEIIPLRWIYNPAEIKSNYLLPKYLKVINAAPLRAGYVKN